jgi:type IV secretion system protein VirB10
MTNSTAAAPASAEKIDRDIPNLTTTKKKNNITRLVIIGGMLFALILLAFGGAVFMERLKQRKLDQNAAKAKERPQQAVVVNRDFEAAKKRIKAEDAAAMPPPASAVPVVAAGAAGAAGAAPAGTAAAGGAPGAAGGTAGGGAGAGAGGHGGGQGPSRAPVETLAQRRLASDVLVPLGGDAAPGLLGAAADRLGSGEPLGARSGEPQNGLGEKLRPSKLQGGVATKLPDLDLLLPRGRVIDCGQKTSIVSTHPGFVSCVVAKDVYSANGSTLLIERGSEAFGESREPLKQGQESLPVLWTTIRTPRGVMVDINSLGTDALGASGIPAYIDHHTGERFGGAVMLSLISDVGQALANSAGSGGGTIRLTTTATAGQDLASKTLESTINIPPTGYSLQGSAIKIFVARDMDFRSVYELATY